MTDHSTSVIPAMGTDGRLESHGANCWLSMSEPSYFYDTMAQSVIVGDVPRRCSRCGRGPEPTAVIDNSGNQFRAICLCVHCLSDLAEAVAKHFPRAPHK